MKTKTHTQVSSRRYFLRILALYVPGFALALPAVAATSNSPCVKNAKQNKTKEPAQTLIVSMIRSLQDAPVVAMVNTGIISKPLKLSDGRIFKVRVFQDGFQPNYGPTYTMEVLGSNDRVWRRVGLLGLDTTTTFRKDNLQISTALMPSV